jgi:hypothetical protein
VEVAVLGFALLAGLAAAVVATAAMIPLPFPAAAEKRLAMISAFVDRFFLGLVIGPAARGLDANGLVVGAVLGLGLSLPTAMITRSYGPILVLGTLLGLAVGIAYEVRF